MPDAAGRRSHPPEHVRAHRSWRNLPRTMRTVAEHVSDPRHAAAALEGAAAVGQAAGPRRLLVRLGVWREGGRIARARYRVSACASLIAYAEVACALLEAGTRATVQLTKADPVKRSVRFNAIST